MGCERQAFRGTSSANGTSPQSSRRPGFGGGAGPAPRFAPPVRPRSVTLGGTAPVDGPCQKLPALALRRSGAPGPRGRPPPSTEHRPFHSVRAGQDWRPARPAPEIEMGDGALGEGRMDRGSRRGGTRPRTARAKTLLALALRWSGAPGLADDLLHRRNIALFEAGRAWMRPSPTSFSWSRLRRGRRRRATSHVPSGRLKGRCCVGGGAGGLGFRTAAAAVRPGIARCW